MKKYYLAGGVTVGLLVGGITGWFLHGYNDQEKQHLIKQTSELRTELTTTVNLYTKNQQKYNTFITQYETLKTIITKQKKEYVLLQKKLDDAEKKITTAQQVHEADKARVTELEQKVSEALTELGKYKEQKEKRTEPKRYVSDLTYDIINRKIQSLSVVMHHVTKTDIATIETTVDRALRSLNKQRKESAEETMLLYNAYFNDPEHIDIGGPWVKVTTWEEGNHYAVKIASSLPGNKEAGLLLLLADKHPEYLAVVNQIRNALK